jgi:peptidoglycan/LPS O-acetylase OafA/YrhL
VTAPARRRFPGLDGLRALGAVAVLTTHTGFQSGDAIQGPFAGVLARLDCGVAIFFVISGFLLFRPHAHGWLTDDDRPATLPYLRNRALRILPALWVAVLAAALLLRSNDPIGWPSFLRYAVLAQVYAGDLLAAGLTQFWSLSVEAAFYLLLPAAGWALTRTGKPTRRRVVVVLATLLTLVPLGAAWMGGSRQFGTDRAALWLPGYLGWFGVGMAFALWHVARTQGVLRPTVLDRLARIPGTLWAGAAAVYLIAATPLAGPYDLVSASGAQAVVKSLLYAVVAGALVFPAIGTIDGPEPRPVRALGGRIGHFLGDISYGVFCYHVIVLALLVEQLGFGVFGGQFGARFGLTLGISVLAATASYYLMERPLLRLGRRDRRYDVSPPPEPANGPAARTMDPSTSA